MKFCYIDESGCGQEPVFVISGIIVDYSRMHLVKEVYADLLDLLRVMSGRDVREFHTRRFYSGSGPWHGLGGDLRANIITALLKLLKERRHSLTFSGVRKDRYGDLAGSDDRIGNLGSVWRAGAFHLALTLQRAHQSLDKNKGHTVLICDRELHEEAAFNALLLDPPTWSDEYYGRHPDKQNALDQLVDVPYFADSEHVMLIQLADLVSFLLPRYAELSEGLATDAYDRELVRMTGWAEQIADLSIARSHRYLSRGRSGTAQLFWELAPESLRALG